MSRFNLRNFHAAAGAMILAGLALAAAPRNASAAGVSGRFVDDARGDAVADAALTGELGDAALFPATDAIAYHDHRYNFTVGAPPDGIGNDWTVHMTNVSGRAWTNLFFVADAGATIGNADGRVEDLLNAPGTLTDAFRIDATGANPNLLSESMLADGIFEPGESWEFAVANFDTGVSSLPPALTSPGVFAGSSPMAGLGGTNASIVGSPVPEPAALGAIALAGCSMLLRGRRRVSPAQ
jgi:hypothetical protein